MNLRAAPIACCLVLATGQAGAGPSSWDEVQLRLLQQHSTPLRWDNVEGAPYRVSGPKPHARFGQRLHLIQLQPGETVTLRAPESRWLRLVGEARTLSADDFEIGISADARMFAAASPLATSDPHSLLVELPPDKPSLVRLNRSLQAESNLVFAACFSREEPFNTFAPHREAVRLPGKSVRLRREGEILSHAARELDPGEELELSLKGPARLELVVTLRWPRNEPRREQSLVLQLALDGAAPVPLWLSPGLDARHRTRVNHATELVSHRMNAFVDVPAGNHRLCLQASAPVYLSLFRQSHSDFLLPWLNGPGTNTMALAHAPWAPVPEISADAIKSLSPTLDARDLAVLEQQAWQLARDNEPLEAGAQADDWLNRVAQSRPDYPAARRTAVAIQRQRTAYQEILPVRMPEVGPLPTFLFAATRLRPLFEPEQHVAVCNPTLEQVDGMFARGHFATVPPAGARGLLYELPERAYDSELRIAALTSAATGSQFLVQFDDEAPFQVVLDAATVLPAEELAASDALATLRVVEQEAHLPANVVLGHPVGAFDLPAPVAEAGVVEVALPQRVRQVRIHLHEATDPVQVSVAYRAAKRFALGETAYLALVNQVGSHEAMRMLAQPEDASATVRPPALELRNHLLPLTRLLRSHSNDFSRSIDPAFLPARTGAPLDAPNAALLRESALPRWHR